MSSNPIYTRLRELSWRRSLNPVEEAELRAWLAAHPEAQADWQSEAALNAGLQALPQAPVPSNFTARVLQAVERESAAEVSRSAGKWRGWLRLLRWLPKPALAAMLVGAGLLAYQQVQSVQRKKLAESVAAVSAISSLPSPEILRDFDAIRAASRTPAPDEQLLALLE